MSASNRARFRVHPSDSASASRAFGRPDGVNGSLVGLDRYHDGEYAPKDQAPDPVLAEAFGAGLHGGRLAATSPRRCRRAGGRTQRQGAYQPDDPWRDPGAAAALGTPGPYLRPLGPSSAALGKLGVRDVLFGGRVSYVALAASPRW